MRAILAGGGTGGHVIPALAIANELREQYNAQVIFVGTARGMETRLVPAAGYELKLVEVGALKRVSLATRLKTVTALPRAIAAAWRIIDDFRPDVVIGVGGYASGPAMLAASFKGLPTVVFEPNVVPGFANKLVAPMASAAAVHFEETCRWFGHCEVTGVPVRQEFFRVPPRPAGTPPTLLLFGGSQGAHALNRVLADSLASLNQRVPGIHIIHQTGERDYLEVQAEYVKAGISAEVAPFIDNMPCAFAAADVLVCRSGASTVAEVAAAGKPAIFVPLPTATDDHQRRNAETLARGGAAMLIPEKELTPGRLVDVVAGLLRDRKCLQHMSEAARRMSHANAAAHIARIAARVAGIPADVQSQHE
ncbi:MAG TPA: undecaprenyldiphospho-muramoylpentapeptide beta-N-acetylglucosaminyltransferase [Clostridia bacterium]|nr:undecaprenyldiphospho-muramoylpentapeptide beta-N-acetylglucosaminyltransferase [Clostridia bacterium]